MFSHRLILLTTGPGVVVMVFIQQLEKTVYVKLSYIGFKCSTENKTEIGVLDRFTITALSL